MMSLEYNPSQAGPSIPPSNPITQPPMDDKKQPKMPEDNMSVVVAKFDFHSQEPSDLSFSKGDHIIVLKRLPDRESWWEGEIGSRRGFFPANYTHDLDG